MKKNTPGRRPRVRGNGEGTVYRLPSGKWQCELRYPVRKTKGGFATKREAIEYLPELKAAVEQLVTPFDYSDLTFAQLYKEWSRSYFERLSDSACAGHRAAYEYYAAIHAKPFAALSTGDFQACVDACPRRRRTKENMKCLAVLMAKHAMSLRMISVNYAQLIYCGKDDSAPRAALPLDAVEKIRQAIGKIPYADYVYILCYTGFRPGEMLALKREAFDAANKTLTGGSKTDAGKDRPITLSPKIYPLVRDLAMKANPYIFPREDGRRMTDEYFRKYAFLPLLDKLGIQPMPKDGEHPIYVPYSCRHTFANLMKHVKGADTDKAALMGHADASMTKYYQSADLDSIRAITDAL